jgi:hypothetical protein
MKRDLDTNPTREIVEPILGIPFDDIFIFEALILKRMV